MEKKRLGIGFIGAGFIANFHLRSWVGVRDADILGIVDKHPQRAEEAASLAKKLRLGEARPFSTIADMVADPGIDAIWILSPNFTRLEVMEEIVAAIESGQGELIGVTCEKP
ncbi:MAG: Gfo/Idh/MocA family protein, partial [Candidatus Aminicenantaceae bacterium]